MRFTPNKNSWVGFAATLTGSVSAPKHADVTGAVDLTPHVTGITASTSGQALPTPTFASDFNTSIPGNVDAQFSLDGYRDDVDIQDLIYDTLPRGTTGFILIARFGGIPAIGDAVEVWPIRVLSRSHPQMTSSTVVAVNVTATVPDEPDEDAVVVT